MKNYDATKETKFILYVDANALYPTNMVYPLPQSKFRKLSEDEIKLFDLNMRESDMIGHFIECDFIIPADIAKKTDELPLGVHHMDISVQDLSCYTTRKIEETSKYLKTANR